MVRVTLDIPLRDYVAARVLSAYRGVPLSTVLSSALRVGLQHFGFSKRPEGVPLQSFDGYYALVQTMPVTRVFDFSGSAEVVSIPLLWRGTKYTSLTFVIPSRGGVPPRVAVGPVYLGVADLDIQSFLLRIASAFFDVHTEVEIDPFTKDEQSGRISKYVLIPRSV